MPTAQSKFFRSTSLLTIPPPRNHSIKNLNTSSHLTDHRTRASSAYRHSSRAYTPHSPGYLIRSCGDLIHRTRAVDIHRSASSSPTTQSTATDPPHRCRRALRRIRFTDAAVLCDESGSLTPLSTAQDVLHGLLPPRSRQICFLEPINDRPRSA